MLSYDDLPTAEGSGERGSWPVFGEADELGCLNWITAREIAAAARLVKQGRVINLDLPLDVPGPLMPERSQLIHNVEQTRNGRDDFLDSFFLQGSTQWDGLQHIRFGKYGFYGGRQGEDLDRDGSLGIDRFAKHGIVGRGVFVDVAAYAHRTGSRWPVSERTPISPELLDSVLKAEGVLLAKGDIILIRTGWLAWFLKLPPRDRANLPPLDRMSSVGLSPSRDMAAWLWNNRIAAVVADNPALEALPVRRDEGFLHHRLVPLLGMLIGELWYLEDLHSDCERDGVYDGLFVSSPLNLPRGVGSPGNGYLLK
jgi:hypothetical protein